MAETKKTKKTRNVVAGTISEIDCLICARTPVIQVITHDEEYFINLINEFVCKERKRELWIWSSWQGLVKYEDGILNHPERAQGNMENTWQVPLALERIREISYDKNTSQFNGGVFIMRDMHTVLGHPIPRQIKDLQRAFSGSGKTIIILGGQLAHGPGGTMKGVEPTLEANMAVVRLDFPTREQVETQIRNLISAIEPDKKDNFKTNYTDKEYYDLSRSLQGLTHVEIDNALNICLVASSGTLDPKKLLDEKKRIISRSDILEYIESSATLNDVGGLANLKSYIRAHANANSKEALEFGVDPLKAVLLLGVPGTGKSLTAKAFGNDWGVPTIRLDVGKVMGSLVGQSEERMRAALQQAKAIAPCILWLDEIEKALSGTKSSNFSDGGTLSRVFGTLLTTMEEGLNGVTVVATANAIDQLPPELIRRFNEVFFVDLPTENERREIFEIHLLHKKRDPKNFDLDKLVAVCKDYTGAEIEKALKEAISKCFNDNMRTVTTDDIVEELRATKPIAILMKEKIQSIRSWAKDRARFASSNEAVSVIHTSTGRVLDTKDLEDSVPTMPTKKTRKARSRVNAIEPMPTQEETAVPETSEQAVTETPATP